MKKSKNLLNKDGLTEEEYLKTYNPGDFKRPSVTTDILILGMNEDYSGLKILLIQRGEHPFIGSWALPGGFIHENENSFHAAYRELQEETGLKDVYLDQVYTFTTPHRDPRTWVMSIAYLALISKLGEVAGDDDARDAAWFDLSFTEDAIEISNEEKDVHIKYSLKKETYQNGVMEYEKYIPSLESSDSLAFDHILIIIEALKKVREQMPYSNRVFNMVEEKFTLPELQAVFEAILGHPVYKKSFRDMISSKVEETGEERQSKTRNGRRCKEYQFKKDI